jgi:hypothetical protein
MVSVMLNIAPLPNLDNRYGEENAATLAAAYEAVVATLQSHRDAIPGRDVRLRMVEAMLATANAGGFELDVLKAAGLVAARETTT